MYTYIYIYLYNVYIYIYICNIHYIIGFACQLRPALRPWPWAWRAAFEAFEVRSGHGEGGGASSCGLRSAVQEMGDLSRFIQNYTDLMDFGWIGK